MEREDMMKKVLKILGFGFLTWLVPFIAAFPLYSRDGIPLYDTLLTKNILFVVFALVLSFLLLMYFRRVDKNYLSEGVIVGATWLGINWLLDLLVIVPMAKMSIGDYATRIGLGYLLMPIICMAIGQALRVNAMGRNKQTAT
jgi:hypothetical protein